jgi:hypothetical protein
MAQYRQLSCHRNDCSFLGVFSSSLGEFLPPAPQNPIGSTNHHQASKKLATINLDDEYCCFRIAAHPECASEMISVE